MFSIVRRHRGDRGRTTSGRDGPGHRGRPGHKANRGSGEWAIASQIALLRARSGRGSRGTTGSRGRGTGGAKPNKAGHWGKTRKGRLGEEGYNTLATGELEGAVRHRGRRKQGEGRRAGGVGIRGAGGSGEGREAEHERPTCRAPCRATCVP